jgi:DNA-binding winged helix-turn-helix (wHTH) protein
VWALQNEVTLAAETENAPNASDWRALTGRWRIGEQAVFDAKRMTVHVAGSESKISHKHAEVLKYLISRRGESVSRDDIRNDGPWADKGGYILDTSVPGAINGIRTALKSDRACLKTGKTGTRSYTLFSVVPCDDEEESEPAAASTSEAGNEADFETEGLETRMADRREAGATVAYTVGGILAVVVIVGSTLGFLRSFISPSAPPPSQQPGWSMSEYVATRPSPPKIPMGADILYGSPDALDRSRGRSGYRTPNTRRVGRCRTEISDADAPGRAAQISHGCRPADVAAEGFGCVR